MELKSTRGTGTGLREERKRTHRKATASLEKGKLNRFLSMSVPYPRNARFSHKQQIRTHEASFRTLWSKYFYFPHLKPFENTISNPTTCSLSLQALVGGGNGVRELL
eukprot:RCo023858